MAIRWMVGAEKAGTPNVETVPDYPGHETSRMAHDYQCPHDRDHAYTKERGPDCKERCKHWEPLYMETVYVGCVLSTREMNGYDDSDFYAHVWDEETQTVKEFCYASTRGWTYPNSARVDATPEVRAKANLLEQRRRLAIWKGDNEKQARMAALDKTVRVVKGRKIPKGIVGTVFWLGEDRYASGRRYRNPMAEALGMQKYDPTRYRIGIIWVQDDQEQKAYLSAANVEVLDYEQYLEPEPSLEAFGEKY